MSQTQKKNEQAGFGDDKYHGFLFPVALYIHHHLHIGCRKRNHFEQ